MRRLLFTGVSVVSLAGCLLVCAIWVKTYHNEWRHTWSRPDNGRESRWVTFRVGGGVVEIMICRMRYAPTPAYQQSIWEIGRYGMLWSRFQDSFSGHDSLHFYDMNLAIIFALLPLVWVFAAVRRSRRSLPGNLCSRCGYDLRASSGRCPECGTRIPAG